MAQQIPAAVPGTVPKAMNAEVPDLVVVIMAGGAGTRFWPVSTERRPKQFLRLIGTRTLLQQSYDRVAELVPRERILVLTAASFVELVREQLPEIPAGNVIGEPCRRDTAAATALAALLCRRRFGNPVLAVLTADHYISPPAAFQRALISAARGARQHPQALYTFGIRPTYPATSYGYLQLGERLPSADQVAHYRLLQFREKPNAETASDYLEAGDYCWNSGIFVWTTAAILAELEQRLPDHLAGLERAAAADGTPEFAGELSRAFEPLRSISIDYAVMEHARQVHCVEATFAWSDVGGWVALADFLEHDPFENAARGQLHVLEAEGNLAFCEDPREHVALVGVRDLIVVRAGNRTLVTTRARAEGIKQLVRGLADELK